MSTSNLSDKHAYDFDDLEEGDLHHQVTKVTTSGNNNEYITIGRTKVLKTELLEAFGGTLNPGYAAPSVHKFANPAPLGLSAFALTTFLLSLVNARTRNVSTSNIVVGVAFFYGGFVQLLAGMWEIALENTFGGVALSSFGGFWMSYAAITIPWFGIAEAYTDPAELSNAIGFFLLSWTIFIFILLLCTLKSTVAFFLLFFTVELAFIFLTVAEFTGRVVFTKVGGYFGLITAFVAWYNAFAGIATKQNSYFVLHAFPLPGSKRIE